MSVISQSRRQRPEWVRKRELAEATLSYAMAGPGIILLFLFLLGPVAALIVIACSDWQFGATTMNFVGLENFAEILTDRRFSAALFNTIAYVAIVVPVTIVLALTIAILIESSTRFRAFYRAAHFLPVMGTMTAMAVAWEAMLHPTIGLINQLLLVFGLPTANWLQDPNTALLTVAVIGIWQNLGFAMVLFLAGLKAIPADLYDAADVDGADGAIDRFSTVTLPMLGPAVMLVLIVIAVRAFETFDTVKVLTKGGPGVSSEVLLHTIYVESFEFFRPSTGAAMTIVFLLIVVSLALLQAFILDKRVHYS